MDFINKLGYKAGVVPTSDVSAQKRCYNCLKKATEVIKEKEKSLPEIVYEPGVPDCDDERTLLKNQIHVFENITHLIEASEGKYNWKKARMFWEYWDKVKHDAVKAVEGPDTEPYLIDAKIDELQIGRFEPPPTS